MDSALNKIGLYEILSVMFSGIIVLLAGLYLGIFSLFSQNESDPFKIIFFGGIENDALKVVVFVVASYFVGIILQEISAWIDGKLFQFQDKVKSDFLNVHVFENPLELDDFRKMSNCILHRSANNRNFNKNDQLYVFFHCKDFLEVHNKEGKSETLSSLCDMSRNLTIAFPFLSLCHVVYYAPYVDIYKILIFLLLTIVFYQRAKKYGKLRILAILRHYKTLTQTQQIS